MSEQDLKNLKIFCKTWDTTYLHDISDFTSNTLQKYAREAIKKKTANKPLTERILHYYNPNPQIHPTSVKKTEQDAEKTLSAFDTVITGARKGDILVGSGNKTKGAVIKIVKGQVYPRKKFLDTMRQYPLVWKKYLNKLNGIDFFSDMTDEEKSEWLRKNEDPGEIAIGEEGDCRFIMLQPGNSDFSNVLNEDQLAQLMEPPQGYLTADSIYEVFPRKPGSTARRQTLIMYKSFWKLALDHKICTNFDGTTIDLYNGIIHNGSNTKPYEEIIIIEDITKKVVKKADKWIRPAGNSGVQSIGLLVSKERYTGNILSLLSEFINLDNYDNIKAGFYNFTPAAHKSLLQKIVRYRPKNILIFDKLYPAEQVLGISMIELISMPGSFVPDIQRYVSGLESFTKRLAVICFEDSYFESPEDMMSLLASALLIQRVKTWKPSKNIILKWLDIGFKMYHSNKAINYGKKDIKPYTLQSGTSKKNVIEGCSAILDELKSFATDLSLARNIAIEYPNYKFAVSNIQPDVMPLEHCIDQHWAPGIALFYRPEFIPESIPAFKGLFGKIWDESSRLNPRRHPIDFEEHEKTPFMIETRRAQNLVLLSRQTKPKTLEINKTIQNVKYKLDTDWLAGMIGALEVAGKPAALVTLRSNDPQQLIAIRRPAREMKESQLSDERYEQVIQKAREMLKKGVSMNKSNAPFKTLAKKKCFLKDDIYYVGDNTKNMVEWDVLRDLSIPINILDIIDINIQNAFLFTGNGVQIVYKQKINNLIENTDIEVVRRALTYISNYNTSFEINRINRDGAGTYQTVSIHDSAAYQFFLLVSAICPMALQPKVGMTGSFVVPVGPLLWKIREKMSEKLIISTNLFGWENIPFRDTTDRKLWNHQQEALNDMIEQHSKGYRGNFLWLDVGSGKTLCVLSYLQYLKENKKLPEYLIYTLPSSAITSIVHEIQAFGLKINLIVPIKNIKNKNFPKNVVVNQSCDFKPFQVNLIEHDYLRRCVDQLNVIAPNSIFIIDEVHKALNDSQRTSISLEISNLAKEFIALTGTPVIDSKTYKLIAWLKQVVNFEVNEKNFWVAANSMIAKKFNTGVKVENNDILALFTPQQEKIYRESVPPALGGSNRNPLSEDWKKAVDVSYQACNTEMIKQTLDFLNKKRGVMLVAKDSAHQTILNNLLIKNGLKQKDIFVLKGQDSIFLTDDAVKQKKVPNYKVVIVPIKKAEGYTLTRLSVMIGSVYPSNQATREQIEGRINRIGQKEDTIYYVKVHAGILTRIMEKHQDAKSLSLALQGLADEIR